MTYILKKYMILLVDGYKGRYKITYFTTRLLNNTKFECMSAYTQTLACH